MAGSRRRSSRTKPPCSSERERSGPGSMRSEQRACSLPSTGSRSRLPTSRCTQPDAHAPNNAASAPSPRSTSPRRRSILAQGAGRLLRTASDHGVVAVLDPRLAVRTYREQLLAAMPPLRRSIDLGDACAFLEHAAANTSVVRPQPSTATVAPTSTSADPRTLRTDLSTTENRAIRNAVACGVCDAEISERCRDENGTSAFVHEGRVRSANP